MFQITDRAARQLKAALAKADHPASACFRIGVAENKVQMVVDQERPGDTTIDHEGETLMVLEPTAGNLLHNRKLDFEDESSGLVLKQAE